MKVYKTIQTPVSCILPLDAEKLLASKGEMRVNGKPVEVEKADTAPADVTLIISGFPQGGTSKMAIEMFLESTKQSGGGEIKYLVFDSGSGRAEVVFKDKDGKLSHAISLLHIHLSIILFLTII